uniref:Uncharacterized protein n=1 Tax=Oncorhynchus kisutch TaxID=8019 RepID=A0A8C7CSW5_ONCKI
METSSRDQAGGGLWNCPRRTQCSKEIQDILKLMMQESRLTNFQQRQLNDKLKRDLEKEKRRLQNILATGQEEPRPSRPRNISLDQGPEEERDRFQEVLDEIEERKEFLEEMTALGKGRQYRNIINTEISQKIHELEVIDKARRAEDHYAREEDLSDREEYSSTDSAEWIYYTANTLLQKIHCTGILNSNLDTSLHLCINACSNYGMVTNVAGKTPMHPCQTVKKHCTVH